MLSKHAVVGSVAALCALALQGCPPSPGGGDAGTDVATAHDVTPSPDVVAVTDSGGGMDVAQTDGARPDVVVADVLNDTAGDSITMHGPDGGTCVITSAVAAHTATMATTGWGARDIAAGLLMYGCTPGGTAASCLGSMPAPDNTNIGELASAMPGAHLKVLYRSTGPSSYWTRISADGRFAARGTHVHDFVRGVEVEAGPTAQYDPAFFPDDSRFMYQPGGLSCPLSTLTTGTPSHIAFTETGCSRSSTVGLYEHLAVSLDGTDYWATSAGAAAWDDGGHNPTLHDPPPNSPWTAGAQTSLTLLANTGTTFSSVSTVSIPTPYQGDGVISPSSTMLMTRLAEPTGHNQIAYVLYQLTATRVGGAVMSGITEIGRYCMVGAKPAFSLDERFVAMHHYVTAEDAVDLGFSGPTDPHFAPYLTRGASNIYLVELATGVRTRVTNMAPGQYALYPAFRADGWIYFNVRTLGSTTEYLVGSDAALAP